MRNSSLGNHTLTFTDEQLCDMTRDTCVVKVDQYLNIKLTDISVTDPDKYPHMLSVKNCFIRGSVVRSVVSTYSQ